MSDLITTADAKLQLKITGSTHDSLLAVLVTNASAFIERICNRTFASTAYEELYNGNGLYRLTLDHFPIISVTRLSDDVEIETKGLDSQISSEDYLIDVETGVLEMFETVFASGQRNIYVKYRAGYASIPDAIKQVCVDLVCKRFYDLEEKRQGVTSRSIMGENISYSIQDLTSVNKLILRGYTNPALVGRNGIPVTGYGLTS